MPGTTLDNVHRTSRQALAIPLVVLLTACATTANENNEAADNGSKHSPAASVPASPLVDPDTFAAAVAQPTRVTVNVHVPFEGAIEGTDLSIPYDQINADAGRLPKDRSTPLAIYCRSGRMSAIAATALASLGYTNITELEGGMDAWTDSGRTLLSRPPADP